MCKLKKKEIAILKVFLSLSLISPCCLTTCPDMSQCSVMVLFSESELTDRSQTQRRAVRESERSTPGRLVISKPLSFCEESKVRTEDIPRQKIDLGALLFHFRLTSLSFSIRGYTCRLSQKLRAINTERLEGVSKGHTVVYVQAMYFQNLCTKQKVSQKK